MAQRVGRRVGAGATRRRVAQFLHLWSFIVFGFGWLSLLSYTVLTLAGETDEIPSAQLMALKLLVAWVASRLVKELADQLERGEWP
jgi:hypothetical protein